MGEFVRRRPFLCFYMIAVSIAMALWTYAIIANGMFPDAYGPGVNLAEYYYGERARVAAEHPLLAAHSDGAPLSILSYIAVPQVSPFLFFPGAPTVAALIVVAIGWGWPGLKALLSLYRPVRGDQSWRDGLRLYAALTLAIAGVAALCAASAYFLTGPDALAVLIREFGLQSPAIFASAWIVALFANQGALFEELGWRGFAWPRLASTLGSPLGAALILGALWALWHFPREIPLLLTGELTIPHMLLGQSLFIVTCCASTIVMVYFVNLSGGSVLPAIMIHGSLNMFYGAFKLEESGAGGGGNLYNHSIIVWIALAALILVIAGPDLGWRARRRLHGENGERDPSMLWARRERA